MSAAAAPKTPAPKKAKPAQTTAVEAPVIVVPEWVDGDLQSFKDHRDAMAIVRNWQPIRYRTIDRATRQVIIRQDINTQNRLPRFRSPGNSWVFLHELGYRYEGHFRVAENERNGAAQGEVTIYFLGEIADPSPPVEIGFLFELLTVGAEEPSIEYLRRNFNTWCATAGENEAARWRRGPGAEHTAWWADQKLDDGDDAIDDAHRRLNVLYPAEIARIAAEGRELRRLRHSVLENDPDADTTELKAQDDKLRAAYNLAKANERYLRATIHQYKKAPKANAVPWDFDEEEQSA